MAEAAPEPLQFADRIIGFDRKPASQFLANPDNPHTHPQAQRTVIRENLKELGWIGVAVENQRTGHLIDGHERVWQALDANDADVPFILIDLSEEEERRALLTFDPIGDMAHYDRDMITRLLGRVQIQDAATREMVSALAKRADLPLNADGSSNTSMTRTNVMGGLEYRIVVLCADEHEQARLIEQWTQEGYSCQALIS